MIFYAGTPSDNEVTPTCFVYDFAPGSDSSTSISKISYIENNKTVTDEAYWSQVKWWPSISYVVLKKHDGNYGESKLFGRSLYVDIISRTPTLDRTILDTLKTFISGYDVDHQ
ncbi:hypothetical protein B566_EDAN007015 [Ephemera danica]|nr:hypothetical protein B566_EDAN007015 [Ephemera danica]